VSITQTTSDSTLLYTGPLICNGTAANCLRPLTYGHIFSLSLAGKANEEAEIYEAHYNSLPMSEASCTHPSLFCSNNALLSPMTLQ
jgi:hypothetical protein